MEIINLSKKYGNFYSLKNINLKINSSFTIITGKSGSGKSTLLNIIGSLDSEYEGSVINEKDLSIMNEKERCFYRNQELGFVFQNFNLEPSFSVYDNVILPSLLGKIDVSKETGMELLKSLDLEEKAKQKVNFVLPFAEKILF